jgi:hypothetical protein
MKIDVFIPFNKNKISEEFKVNDKGKHVSLRNMKAHGKCMYSYTYSHL